MFGALLRSFGSFSALLSAILAVLYFLRTPNCFNLFSSSAAFLFIFQFFSSLYSFANFSALSRGFFAFFAVSAIFLYCYGNFSDVFYSFVRFSVHFSRFLFFRCFNIFIPFLVCLEYQSFKVWPQSLVLSFTSNYPPRQFFLLTSNLPPCPGLV